MLLTHTEDIESSLILAMQEGQREYAAKKGKFTSQFSYDAEFSVTTLAQPVQMYQLKTRYRDKIVRDARKLLYVVLGNLFHSMAEKYPMPGDIVEERFGKVFNVKIGDKVLRVLVHGAADRLNRESGYIKDYKLSKMSAMQYEKADYIQQLNLLRFLSPYKDEIKALSNIFAFRDYNAQAACEGRSPLPNWSKEVFYDIWTDEQCKQVLSGRVRAHLNGQLASDEELPPCTKEELWTTRDGFRVRHKTLKGEWSKVATGWAETEEECGVIGAKKRTEFRLEPTGGIPRRCEWCDAATTGMCKQYNAMQSSNEQASVDETESEVLS